MAGSSMLLSSSNPFRMNPPNGEEMAAKYPFFAQFYGPENDEKFDFDELLKKAELEYPITKAFMKEYFDMELLLPADEQTESVPLVMNHLLLIEEYLQTKDDSDRPLEGLVIGAGAACVYSLLGAKVLKWNFVCTESDNTKYEYAVMNVANNILSSSIQVLKMGEECTLCDIFANFQDRHFDFVIYNYPKYEDDVTKLEDEKEQFSEKKKDYVAKYIDQSTKYRKQVRMFFLKVGDPSKCHTTRNVIQKLRTYKKCCKLRISQFVYMGWTFDRAIKLPRSLPKQPLPSEVTQPANLSKKRPHKSIQPAMKRPLSWCVPEGIRCLEIFDRSHLIEKMKILFRGLLIPFEEEELNDASGDKCLIITAHKNTWLQRDDVSDKLQEEENGQASKGGGQRKKRGRRGKGKNKTAVEPMEVDPSNPPAGDCSPEAEPQEKRSRVENPPSPELSIVGCSNPGQESFTSETDVNQAPDQVDNFAGNSVEPGVDQLVSPEKNNDATAPTEPVPEYLIKARLYARNPGGVLTVEMEWVDGSVFNDMHSIFQFLQNNLKYT